MRKDTLQKQDAEEEKLRMGDKRKREKTRVVS